MPTKTVQKTTKKTEVKKAVKVEKVMEKTEKKAKKTLTGTVVSTKMQQTVVVLIERKVAHKLYGKLIKVSKKIKADTNGMKISEGDVVVIEQTRPVSKDKNFKVVKIKETK
jgi:small subunit ribosomal protein S17